MFAAAAFATGSQAPGVRCGVERNPLIGPKSHQARLHALTIRSHTVHRGATSDATPKTPWFRRVGDDRIRVLPNLLFPFCRRLAGSVLSRVY